MAQDDALVPMETQLYYSIKKTSVSRSWILFDIKGEGTILDLDKYDILRRIPIHGRDLRILDPLLSYPSIILGRDKAIVLNLEHIKAIITADEVLLRDPMDDNVLPIAEELQRRLPMLTIGKDGEENDERLQIQKDVDSEKQSEFPFEFRALEVALDGICSYLDARATELEINAYPALDELTSKISSRNLDRVRKLKFSMSRLCSRVQRVRDELGQLLEDDVDMAELYLTRKLVDSSPMASRQGVLNWINDSPTPPASKVSRTSRNSTLLSSHGEHDVEELEMLLEAYFMQIESTMNKLITLREYIDDTEDYINIQLDSHRNRLIQLELFLNSSTLCLSVYSLVAAILSVNIPFTWTDPEYSYLFKWVVVVTGVACAFIFIFIISYARHKGLVGSI